MGDVFAYIALLSPHKLSLSFLFLLLFALILFNSFFLIFCFNFDRADRIQLVNLGAGAGVAAEAVRRSGDAEDNEFFFVDLVRNGRLRCTSHTIWLLWMTDACNVL